MNESTALHQRIQARHALIGIIGLGYVGTALASEVAASGFDVVGFDISEAKVRAINESHSEKIRATTDKAEIAKCNVIILCIQTPVQKDKTPDLAPLKQAVSELTAHLTEGTLVIIESTIAVGTTRNHLLPLLEQTGMREGETFFLAFSPERVDPGNKTFQLRQIPKIVSGISKEAYSLAIRFYGSIMETVVPVSSVETAEMTKLFENTFRLVNISLVNELTEYTRAVGINIQEVIKAASTKPFGFLPHYPGPGAGGHCIPVDPYYLIDDAKRRNVHLSLVENAGDINDTQPLRVVARALEAMRNHQRKMYYLRNTHAESLGEQAYAMLADGNGHVLGNGNAHAPHARPPEKAASYKHNNVLLVGLAYKPDTDDTRDSPALKLWEIFEDLGNTVSYHDPFIPKMRSKTSAPLIAKTVKHQDIVVIVTNHSSIDYSLLTSHNVPILDTRYILDSAQYDHVYYL